MNPDTLRQGRKSYTTVFLNFTKTYKKSPSDLFCFFEGDDYQYYGIRVRNITQAEKISPFNCQGKTGVIKVREQIIARQEYKKAKTAYFIDKDFDESIYVNEPSSKDDVYETPCYSIENLYTSKKVFQEILKSEFKLDEIDGDFQKIENIYSSRQSEFHNEVELLNAWIAHQKSLGYKLNLSSYTISNFINVSLDKITSNYDLSKLAELFSDCQNLCHEDLKEKTNEFCRGNKQKDFRGKFEADFLYKILTKLIEEANKKSSNYFSRKLKVRLQISRQTMISDLSQYADTPPCLVSFLKKFAS